MTIRLERKASYKIAMQFLRLVFLRTEEKECNGSLRLGERDPKRVFLWCPLVSFGEYKFLVMMKAPKVF